MIVECGKAVQSSILERIGLDPHEFVMSFNIQPSKYVTNSDMKLEVEDEVIEITSIDTYRDGTGRGDLTYFVRGFVRFTAFNSRLRLRAACSITFDISQRDLQSFIDSDEIELRVAAESGLAEHDDFLDMNLCAFSEVSLKIRKSKTGQLLSDLLLDCNDLSGLVIFDKSVCDFDIDGAFEDSFRKALSNICASQNYPVMVDDDVMMQLKSGTRYDETSKKFITDCKVNVMSEKSATLAGRLKVLFNAGSIEYAIYGCNQLDNHLFSFSVYPSYGQSVKVNEHMMLVLDGRRCDKRMLAELNSDDYANLVLEPLLKLSSNAIKLQTGLDRLSQVNFILSELSKQQVKIVSDSMYFKYTLPRSTVFSMLV